MALEYEVQVFIDAHDEFPARKRHHETAEEAFSDAISRAENLATEEGRTLIGTAGDGEVAEVYPEFGSATVVIVHEGEEPEQPRWLEVSSTEYDCGECGHSFLDRVFWFPDTAHEGDCLACPECGWSNISDENAVHDVEWYAHRYSA